MCSRLEKVYRKAQRIRIDPNSRIVCMSDCHRGVGNRGDNFLPNRNLFLAALQYYYQKGFSYVELGDGDELWENKNLDSIREMHCDVFQMLLKFESEERLLMLYGNHDCQKRKQKYQKKCCAHEAIVLEDKACNREIFLVHGHQGDIWNDTLWPVAKFLVRHVWKPLEMLGIADPTSAAHNYRKCKKTEKRLDSFSKEKEILVIAGHTHRPVLPKPGESFYMNDGSCVHPGSITALEMEQGAFTLVKWKVSVSTRQTLVVVREVMEGPYRWDQYRNVLKV